MQIRVVVVAVALTFFGFRVSGQGISTVGTGSIVELEAEQSSVTGTMVVSSMERETLYESRSMIHRSTDNGLTWDLVYTIEPYEGDIDIPDPVLATDEDGIFYLAVMRVYMDSDPSLIRGDIELHRSDDDGQTWTQVGIPHFDDSVGDYPQITSRGSGELFLTYSYLEDFPLGDAVVITKKSTDGGSSWTSGVEIDVHGIGVDISWAENDKLLISVPERVNSLLHTFTSSDLGDTWNELHTWEIPNEGSAHISKPISNPLYGHIGVISHMPHQENTEIVYYSAIDGELNSMVIDFGAYAEGLMTDDGIIHLVYNKRDGDIFSLLYVYSDDEGASFSDPTTLYSGTYTESHFGEYQSLMLGNDGLLYLTFCDWSDISKAKVLTFPPLVSTGLAETSLSGVHIFPNPTTGLFQAEMAQYLPESKVSIYDLNGKMVEPVFIQSDRETMRFDVSNFERGVYLVVIEGENKIVVEKLVKK